MDPLIGAGLITGGANLLGSIFGANTSAENTEAQIQSVQQQEQFQQQMSSTAYQRASADMKAAGLNPMMMFGSGGAASSPAGANIGQVNRQSPLQGLGQAVQSGLSAAVSAKSMDKMTDEMANLKVENEKLKAETDESRARASLQTGELRNIDERTRTQQAVTAQELNRARTAENEMNIDPSARRVGDKTKYWSGVAQPVADVVATGVSSATGAGRLFNDMWRDRAMTTSRSSTNWRPGGVDHTSESWRQ